MSDQNNENEQVTFQLQRAYLKDMSLEQPNTPAIFLEQGTPEIDVSVKIGTQKLAESVIESSVTATVTAKLGDKVVFLVECTQAGIFEIRNIPEDQMGPLLGIGCPSIIYPYLRANIADAITRTSFPPVHLSEINFEALYEERMQAEAQKEQTTH